LAIPLLAEEGSTIETFPLLSEEGFGEEKIKR
jgi:hypothetical protein